MSYEVSVELVRADISNALKDGMSDHRKGDVEFDNLAMLLVHVIRFGTNDEIVQMQRMVDGLRAEASELHRENIVAHLDMAARMLTSASRRRPSRVTGTKLPKRALDAASAVLYEDVAEAYEPKWRDIIQRMHDAIQGQSEMKPAASEAAPYRKAI